MRDPGLDRAVAAAGGVGALARKIGIAQPSVSNWSRVPAERVLTVEAVTGVSRAELRPDLFGEQPVLDEIDVARASEYALLATLLARAPEQALLDRIAGLRADPSALGLAHAALAEAAQLTSAERAEREYFDLFIGLGRGELLPYGSYYLAGFLHERPLARLRDSLAQLGIERAAGQAEPEEREQGRASKLGRRDFLRVWGVGATAAAAAAPLACGVRAATETNDEKRKA